MSYPFYLGEGLISCAARLDFLGFTALARRNINVIMNTPRESLSAKKLRVSAMVSLIVRAVYRAGADPERLQAYSLECYKNLSTISARQRDQVESHLLDLSCRALELVPQVPQDHPSLLQRFFDQIEQDKDRQLTVQTVARNLKVSPSHLSRTIRAMTTRTPSTYIRLAKLSRARERFATESVTRAALDSGFSKISSFICHFRKQYGETPGSFKRRLETAD